MGISCSMELEAVISVYICGPATSQTCSYDELLLTRMNKTNTKIKDQKLFNKMASSPAPEVCVLCFGGKTQITN